jgi:hypothetical protein
MSNVQLMRKIKIRLYSTYRGTELMSVIVVMSDVHEPKSKTVLPR